VRRDPMAMLPSAATTWAIISALDRDAQAHQIPPRIFHVNWFRKDAMEIFLARLRRNMRVLKWIVDRCNGRAKRRRTPLGWVPYAEGF